jgi:hypothetical protein
MALSTHASQRAEFSFECRDPSRREGKGIGPPTEVARILQRNGKKESIKAQVFVLFTKLKTLAGRGFWPGIVFQAGGRLDASLPRLFSTGRLAGCG